MMPPECFNWLLDSTLASRRPRRPRLEIEDKNYDGGRVTRSTLEVPWGWSKIMERIFLTIGAVMGGLVMIAGWLCLAGGRSRGDRGGVRFI